MLRLRRVCSLLALSALIFASAAEGRCQNTTLALESMAPASIAIRNSHAEIVELQARVANDMTERAGGFQHICPDVVDRTAILFVFMDPRVGRFHMRNVYAPLDIAFISDDGRIFDIQRMEAEPPGRPVVSRTYGPTREFRYALEARAGFFSDHAIRAGASYFDVERFGTKPQIGPTTRSPR